MTSSIANKAQTKRDKMNEFQKMLVALHNVQTLKRFGVALGGDGEILLVDGTDFYAYREMEKDLTKGEEWFNFGPTGKQIATLGLAIYQEECNRFIDQEEIDTVNQLLCFETPITYAEVQGFNSKYI